MLPKIIISFFSLLLFSACHNTERPDVILESDLPDSTVIEKEVLIRDTIYLQDLRSNQQWFIDTLKAYLGTKEINGSNSGPIVDLFFEKCGVPPKNPWCGCFQNFGMIAIGQQGPSAPAWTPAWFPKSKVVWTRGIDSPNYLFPVGSFIGIYFNRLNRIAHIGSVIADFGDGYVLTIEGNTNSAGGREGNGVYIRIRHKSEIYQVSIWVT